MANDHKHEWTWHRLEEHRNGGVWQCADPACRETREVSTKPSP